MKLMAASLALLALALLAAACATAPPAQPPGLDQQAVAARHTQEWIEVQQTATAAAANASIATEAAEYRQTEMAAAARQTETAEHQLATQIAGTQVAVFSQATATAQTSSMGATATQAGLYATATVQAARAATVATQEAAEQRRIELTNGVRALVPWIILLASAVVLLVLLYRYGKAVARQAGVIRHANGEVYTVLVDSERNEVRAVNPEKSLDPVIRLERDQVRMVGFPDPRLQLLVTHNAQRLAWARQYVTENRRITDRALIEELKGAFAVARAPEQLPTAVGAPPHLVHPHYGIDPMSLPEIPLFDVGSRLLAGGSRSGKTNLAQYDLFRMGVQILGVYDPKYRPGKWPEQAQVMTEPEELVAHLVERQKIFEHRRDTQGTGYSPVVTVIDEYTALVELSKLGEDGPAIKEALARAWALVMYGAEFGVNIWILSQTSNAASLGLSGRGDFRNSLTRIMFEWRPTSREEMNIPRIAEVSTGDSTDKYLVPRWSPPVPRLSSGSPQPVPGTAQDSPGQSRTVPDRLIAHLRAGVPCAAEFSDEELSTIVEMHAAGESGNAIREKLGRSRSWIYELIAACREYGDAAEHARGAASPL